MKKCSQCKQTRPLSDFHNDASRKDGKQYKCKDCNRASNKAYQVNKSAAVSVKQRMAHLKRSYGLSKEEHACLLALQGGVCAICKKTETAVHWGGKTMQLHIDHDHQTGKVRGLLCGKCNTALGLLQDDASLLIAALEYLAVAKK